MIFNSLAFAIFLPIVLFLYHLSGYKKQNWILLIAGYVFYGAWDIRFLYLVSLSTVLDYCTGLMIGQGNMSLRQRLAPTCHLLGFCLLFLIPNWQEVVWSQAFFSSKNLATLFTPSEFGVNVLLLTCCLLITAHGLYPILSQLPEQKKRLFFLRCSLFGQLGMLGVFKYYNFFISSAENLAKNINIDISFLHLDIVLPIGISFYTFQTLSYVCDVYWRRMKPVQHLHDFALFVCYFPPLVAGPIERASHLVPKILTKRTVNFEQIAHGSYLILLGLVKKITIADGLAGTVASIYNSTGTAGWLDIVVSTVAFTLQIYGDFSGYSDIASGVSLLFGIELLRNFNQPYFSVNPSEFWRRWHISLSSWLRDYLYIPLGGNRGTEISTLRNLMLTMVLGGLWHGAAWNFILWGGYQGSLLVIHRLLTKEKTKVLTSSLLARLPKMLFFMIFVCYGWLLFRANSLEQILDFTKILFTDFSNMQLHAKQPTLAALAGVVLLMFIEFFQFKTQSEYFYVRCSGLLLGLLYAGLFTLLLMGISNGTSEQFIYFQF